MTPGLVLATVVGSLAYLGLAVLGWGGFAGFFAHPARIALTLVFVALVAAAIFSGGNLSSGEREDRSNRWVLAAFTGVGLLLAWLPAWSDRAGVWVLDGDAVRWLGVLLFAAGGALRLWPVYVLGRRFSGLVAIQPGHELVTEGVYRVIRHPSYLGLIVSTARLGARLPLRARPPAGGAPDPAAHRPHPRRGGAAAGAVRGRVRRLSQPDLAARPGALLSAEGAGWASAQLR